MTRKPIAVIFAFSFLFSLLLGSFLTYKQLRTREKLALQAPSKPQILGMFGMAGGGGYSRSARPGQMFVYGGENSFGTGGIISMSSLDEPILGLSAYNISGEATITTYVADRESVLKYAIHDSEGMQVNKKVDSSNFQLLQASSYSIRSNNETNRIPLPIEGKGIWYVTIEVGNSKIDGFIVRSDVGLIAKEGDGKFLFWAQKFEGGLRTSEGKLSLYNLQDSAQVITTASFNQDGIAQSDLTEQADLAVYSSGEDFSLLPLNLQYLNVGSRYHPFAKAGTLSRYFIFTDRPVYEPGQEVHFKAIIRTDDDARYSIPGGEAKVTITTGNNEKKLEKSYPISEGGSISGSYKLGKDVSVGTYVLNVEVGPKSDNINWGEYSSNSTYFSVENYQKPESFISVDTPKLEYISGDSVDLQIQGTYFSGQPLISTEIKYKVSAVDFFEYTLYSDQQTSYRGPLDTFYGSWYGSQTVAEGTLTLDNTGQATVPLDTKQLDNPSPDSNYTKGKSKIFVVEATQNDGSLSPSYSIKNFLVYAGDWGIYQNSRVGSGKINTPYTLPLKLSPYFREVNLSLIDLTASIYRETWVKDDVQNSKYPTYHKEEEDLGQVKLKTNQKGETALTFTPKKQGYYKLKIEGYDQQSNYIAKEFYAYISDRDLPIYRGAESPEISLTLDQDKYNPSDTAQLEIVTSIADRDVLVTIERGRLARYQVEHIAGKNKTIDLKLEPTDVPNIYVTVSSFNPYGLDMAEINLPVSASGKKLDVTLTPSSLKYGPGDSASVEILVQDDSGNPIAAEVALWAVDKAIFELASSNLGNIFDTFWAPRSDTTAESHSLMGILTQQAEGGGGGGDKRSVFKDTAYWNPSIKTDKNGKANVKFKLPDNLTTWTLAGVASTKDTRVGQSTKEITVNKDIVVRPVLPNILRAGDKVKLSALVQNFTDTSHTFDVQLTFDSGAVAQNTWENVQIPSLGMERLSWELSPTKINDVSQLTITARATSDSSLSDQIQVELPVRQFGYLERTGLSGLDNQSYALPMDPNIDLAKSNSTLSLSPSLLSSLPTAMDYLVNYSYACVEQTVSRLVPSLLIAQNPDLFKETAKTKAYTKVIDKSLARLASMQHGDGGWAWWYSGKSDPFITRYVIENLALAAKLGYKVSPHLLERGHTYLTNSAKELDSPDPDLLALKVISAYQGGDHNPLTNGLKTLTSLAQSQGDTYFWAAGSQKRFGSIQASTALALRALIVAKGDRSAIDKAALYLTRARQADYWSNTFATSQVLSALTAYAKLSDDLTPNYTYRIEGDLKKNGTITSSDTVIKDLELDLAKIKDSLDLVITKEGKGNLYSTLVTSQFLTARNQGAQSRGISLSKKFENAKGADLPIAVGDTLNVVLTISGLASDDKYGVILDDLPSGLVPVNTSLNNEQSSWNVPPDYEDGFSITNTDVTENGVILSLYNVSSSERTYAYKARAVSAGTYAVPPATVSLMYAPEIHGRTSTSELTIQDMPGTPSGKLTNKLIINKTYLLLGTLISLALASLIYFIIKARRKRKVDEV